MKPKEVRYVFLTLGLEKKKKREEEKEVE